MRRVWWRQFHPLVRVGWIAATAGNRRTVTQTAIGIGLMGAGVYVRRSGKRTPIYTHTIGQGETVRIRVYRGDAASEAIVRAS